MEIYMGEVRAGKTMFMQSRQGYVHAPLMLTQFKKVKFRYRLYTKVGHGSALRAGHEVMSNK